MAKRIIKKRGSTTVSAGQKRRAERRAAKEAAKKAKRKAAGKRQRARYVQRGIIKPAQPQIIKPAQPQIKVEPSLQVGAEGDKARQELQQQPQEQAPANGIEEIVEQPVLKMGLKEAIIKDIADIKAGKNLPNLQDVAMALGAHGVVSSFQAGAGRLISPAKANAATSAGRHAINTVSQKLTSSVLIKIAKDPRVAGTLLGMLGTYPFAGFIKEEALQTLGFATESAYKNKDLQGMREALDLQREILNPTIWGQILGIVPFANILTQLKSFYEAAIKKTEIDEKRFLKLQKELVSGVSERQKQLEEEAEFFRREAQAREDIKTAGVKERQELFK